MLFQGGALFDSLTVWENIAFALIYRDGVGRTEAKKARHRNDAPRSASAPASPTYARPSSPAACRNASPSPAPSSPSPT